MKTAVVSDRRYLEHDTGPGHPERAERLEALLTLVDSNSNKLVRIPPRLATEDEILLVHDGSHIEAVADSRHLARSSFDLDTPVCDRSFHTAQLGAGGFLSLLDSIMAGETDNGFAFVRPPGHHAERSKAMGFCLFNNVAIGAAYLRLVHKLQRVLIVDWDVHHGNGTQHIFESDPGVLYLSLHQFPFYPGTGAADEVGAGDGSGFSVNVPFPAGWGDAEYTEAFTRVVEPIAYKYSPDFILISAGFDAHFRDPLGAMKVSETGFGTMTDSLLAVARDCSGGRCAAVLEGGYDLQALHDSVAVVLDRMLDDNDHEGEEQPRSLATSQATELLGDVARVQRNYWSSLA